MAIENWSDDKVSNMSIASVIIVFLISVTFLMAYGWKTSNDERELMSKAGYQECVVYIPNLGSYDTVWQKKCQVIKMYPGTVIKK